MIYHLLITRFNLAVTEWQEIKLDKCEDDESWLTKRIPLFLKICLPSVVQQSCKDFKWIIFFEQGTQNSLQDVLKALEPHSFIFPVFVKGIEGFNRTLPILIEEARPKDAFQIVSSRLDNDDALHRDFILNIQKSCSPDMDKIVLDFPEGLCVELSDSPKVSKYIFPKNQFISLVEHINENESPEFIFSTYHNKVDLKYPIKTLPQKRQWLQVVHEDNLVNTFKGQLTYKNALNGYPDYGTHFAKNYNFIVFLEIIKLKFNRFPGYYLLKKIIKRLFNE
ncbi:glycosyltransferase [Yeosuana sp. AK3]